METTLSCAMKLEKPLEIIKDSTKDSEAKQLSLLGGFRAALQGLMQNTTNHCIVITSVKDHKLLDCLFWTELSKNRLGFFLTGFSAFSAGAQEA